MAYYLPWLSNSSGGGGSTGIALFYTDLADGPNTGGENDNGVPITLYGVGFGASRGTGSVTLGGGSVAAYVSWSDTKIVVQPGSGTSTGNFVVTNNSGQSTTGCICKPYNTSNDFTVRSGAIYYVSASGSGSGTFASPMAPSSVDANIAAGVTFIWRAGTYTGQYASTSWSNYNIVLGSTRSGTAGNTLAFIAYPGETVTFDSTGRTGCFQFRNSGTTADHPDYVAVCGFQLHALYVSVGGGAYTAAADDREKSGCLGMRIIGNDCWTEVGTAAIATGIITVGNDGARVLGNTIRDSGTAPAQNLNHGVYIQVGSSDVDVAWNRFTNLVMGWVIQCHTDTPFVYTGVRIHDNYLEGTIASDCRGINFGEVADGTTGSVYNNVLTNLGQDVGALAVYGGSIDVVHNTFHNIDATVFFTSNVQGGTRSVVVRNNIFWPSTGNGYVSIFSSGEVTFSHNLYYNGGSAYSGDSSPVTGDPLFTNAGSLDFTLQSSSPARNAGTSTTASTVAPKDRNGVSRPQGASYDIGAYEYV
jgi:hypothetical protein